MALEWCRSRDHRLTTHEAVVSTLPKEETRSVKFDRSDLSGVIKDLFRLVHGQKLKSQEALGFSQQ